MAVILLDTTVIIDVITGRRGRSALLHALLEQGHFLACCSINVTEVYAGMRSHEVPVTEALLKSLKFYPVDWETARLAGQLKSDWAKKGHTLLLPDVTIASVAIANNLTLATDNRKDFPMPELTFLALPDV